MNIFEYSLHFAEYCGDDKYYHDVNKDDIGENENTDGISD